jgi:spore photoproduct lyase
MNTIKSITHVVFIKDVAKTDLFEKISKSITSASYIETDEDKLSEVLKRLKKEKIMSKKVLVVHKFKGRLIQICPGSKGMICCNYMLINTGFNCLYDCSYCFLLGYLNSYGVLIFANINDICREIDEFIKNDNGQTIFRIGTGEFTDSLMIDEFTGLSEKLIGQFSSYKKYFLEIKTKSSNVDHILNIKNKGNTVISWSLNTERNIDKYEQGTAQLKDRINSAIKAYESGYWVSFHFDPIILYNDWEKDYGDLLNMLMSAIPVEKILWISMGGLRFTNEFREILREKNINEDLTLDEFTESTDGKIRYFKPIRMDIYRMFRDYFTKMKTSPFIYMCMESSDMWEAIFGKNYDSSSDLENDFKKYLVEKCHI